jgi:hypothetical protein
VDRRGLPRRDRDVCEYSTLVYAHQFSVSITLTTQATGIALVFYTFWWRPSVLVQNQRVGWALTVQGVLAVGKCFFVLAFNENSLAIIDRV